jgi:molybdopterin-containing oxidoreductase family iron-sulfur binding subunit
MSLNRRGFVRTGLLAAGATAVGVAAKVAAATPDSAETDDVPATLALTPDGHLVAVHQVGPASTPPQAIDARRGIAGRKWVMVFDLAACDGCGDCTEECGKMHFIPPDREWIRVYKMQDSPETTPYWFPKPCFHCDNPPCTKVCPVGATFKREDGLVLIDNNRCIGCRFCMAACPYSTRVFNWGRPTDPAEATAQDYSPEHGYPRRVGTVEKCDFCPDMAREGKLPHCAGRCKMGAIYFGDENEDAVTNGKGATVRLSSLLRDRAAYRYFEELGTHPRVYYLPPTNRRYEAPTRGAGHKAGERAEAARP